MRLLLAILFVLVAAPVWATPLRVMVSIAPQVYITERVAGELAHVEAMVPPGASPHGYEPKPSQMAALSKSDLYLGVGVEFEDAWLPRLLGANGKLPVVDTSAGIKKMEMLAHDHDHEGERHGDMHHDDHEGEHHEGMPHHGEEHEGEHHEGMPHHGGKHHDDHAKGHDDHDDHHAKAAPHEEHGDHHDDHHGEEAHHDDNDEHHGEAEGLDPHVWLAPLQVQKIVAATAKALADADPANAAVYAANAKAFSNELHAMHEEIEHLFEGKKNRRFLVFHPSWGYFAHEFGLEQMAVEVGGREPGPRELVQLLEEAEEHGVRSVFVAPQFSKRTAQSVAEELGGELVEADPLAADWKANLLGVAKRLAKTMY